VGSNPTSSALTNHCARDDFLYELKAGPAGGRLRRPSSAGNTGHAGAPPAGHYVASLFRAVRMKSS
jgi:hypothetical protein